MIKLIFPCNYIGITQGYKSSHKAIDLGWSKKYGGINHPIIAPYDGKVTYVKRNYNKRDSSGSSYGNYIKIDHGNNITTLVAHLKYNSVKVNVGDKVKKGDVIASMGDTGHATGVHCHYEVRINNERVHPLKYTYVSEGQVVSTNTKAKYNLLYITKEENNVQEETKVEETTTKTDNIIFEYLCNKTGMYKIQLNENEKLVIID